MKKHIFSIGILALAGFASAQVINPIYAGSYSLVDLGSAPGVPGSYGGIVGNPNSLNSIYLGGTANSSGGAIYNVEVNRTLINGQNRISSFTANNATVYSAAPFIDGGLVIAPNGNMMYTGYSNNTIGEIKPGSVTPDRITTMTSFGISSSVGALTFVPAGAPGAGRLKVMSYSASTWYDVPFAVDGSGLYTFGAASAPISLGGGLEGVVYVPGGSALIPDPAILVSEYGTGNVVLYDVDANGDPIVGTRRVFISGLSGAEGAMIDPTTGDFLFSTFGSGNRVIAVRGFAAVPEPMSMVALGLGALALIRKKRKSASE